jgi:hypothetical protein
MREIFLLSEDFISRMSVTWVWGQCPRSKSEQSSRDDNNLVRLGWAVFYYFLSFASMVFGLGKT